MFKKKLIILLFTTILFLQSFVVIENHQSEFNTSIIKEDSLVFAVVGDLMCHSVQFNAAKTDSSYDFNPVYQYVKDYFSLADFTMGNLETTISDKDFTGYPLFKTPKEYVTALKNNGFNILFTSNNHSYDSKKAGVLKTIETIENNNLHYYGTNKSQKERDSVKIISKNNIKFTVLSYAEHLNGFTLKKNEKYLVNLIDTLAIKNDIKKSRKAGAEIIIVYLHYGNEYERKPSKYQKNIVKKLIEYGADVILASHPHVLQTIEFFKPKNEKIESSIIAYSLGNFISNQQWRYSDAGLVLYFTIKKNKEDSFIINNVRILPTWVYRNLTDNKGYYILPSYFVNYNNKINLTEKEKSIMTESFNDTKEIIYTDSNKIKNISLIKPDTK